MSTLGIELYLFVNVITVDEYSLVFIGFCVKNRHSVLEREIQLKVYSQVDDSRDSIDDDETFRLHLWIIETLPS